MSETDVITKADVLVVGTGPAGGTMALALARLGVDVMVINKYPWTAPTPRAHITNQRTVEVLRDLGLAEEALALATPNDLMGENTYCTSLAGEELGRLRTWGTQPHRRSDYELASPEQICDLPQNLLEPLLVGGAARQGARVRFSTEFLRCEQDSEGVTSWVRERDTGREYAIRSKYLIGADGANSRVVDQAGLPLEGKMGVSGSINIVFEADLSRFVAHRPSVLYWIFQPGSSVGGMGIGVVRMVRPWHKWLAIWGYEDVANPPKIDQEFAKGILYNLIGNNQVDIKIESFSTWTVNDMYATKLSTGRIYCMGDAVHRHPPTNGLGSNHSIQDAYNLAWKMALVLGGKAGPDLLDSYNAERAPVAKQTVTRANKSLGCFPPILEALGLFGTDDPEQMRRNMASIKDSTPEAAARRAALRAAIDRSDFVYNCHGVEMNQRYASDAVVGDGTAPPQYDRDPELFYQPTSFPGARLPHGWVSRDGARVSTLALCGDGVFTLLTGLGGEAWVDAAAAASAQFGVPIRVHVIGPGRPIEDPHGDFARIREVSENGAILVRPDVYVGWRAEAVSADATDRLCSAMATILALPAETILKHASEMVV
ncbi:FAD-dependent monooxygenase [Rhizorhabdus histidinilytica]|nr:FAD-dependent monooxygenase [Rhizorhabdus histidinilytica]